MTPTSPSRRDWMPGLVAAAIVACIYGAIGLSVDVPQTVFGIQSDEATYYMMSHSLADDGDLAYRREDLARVWRDFASGPSGVFLKKGRDVAVSVDGRAPFVHVTTKPTPDAAQLFYGKSYIYPLFASPFVWLFGTNGFFVFHALMLGVMMLVGYAFLNARSSPLVSLTLASAFLFASVAPAYYAWMTPELFNLTLVVAGYFCWLYKEVASPDASPRGTGWLFLPRSDFAAAAILGLATFSKPSNLLLILPLLVWQLRGRHWRRMIAAGILFALVGGVFVVGNVAVTGDWNYQGGERRTFYGPYPFENRQVQWEGVGQDRATNRVLTEIIFDTRVFGQVFSHNAVYFFIGRNSGLVPYFFPSVFASVLLLLSRRSTRPWQWLVLGAGLAEILLLLIWVPYTYNGGGGSIGNRYFMNSYGVFLFLLPPIESVGLAFVPWAVGALFSAQIAFNPFFASYNPAQHTKQGPARWLPVELTLVNDLPINTQANRARIWFGQARRFQIYFLDDNAYAREGLGFWSRGGSTADMLIKTVEPASALELSLAAGAVPTTVTVRRGWSRQQVSLAAGATAKLSVPLDEGFPYNGTRVWKISIRSSDGFVPYFVTPGAEDRRFLGVSVVPELRQ